MLVGKDTSSADELQPLLSAERVGIHSAGRVHSLPVFGILLLRGVGPVADVEDAAALELEIVHVARASKGSTRSITGPKAGAAELVEAGAATTSYVTRLERTWPIGGFWSIDPWETSDT